jgi:hypothetical protein
LTVPHICKTVSFIQVTGSLGTLWVHSSFREGGPRGLRLRTVIWDGSLTLYESVLHCHNEEPETMEKRIVSLTFVVLGAHQAGWHHCFGLLVRVPDGNSGNSG